MATEECAICGDAVPFATTTHVLVNPKHEDGVADHYVCRPCYDEHLEGLFVALADDEDTERDDLDVNVDEGATDGSGTDGSPDGSDVDGNGAERRGEAAGDGESVDASPE